MPGSKSNWKVFSRNGRIFFAVGNQSFMLDFEPEDEPEMTAVEHAEWYMNHLRIALSNITHDVKTEEQDEITRLRSEVEALREDADRYRWLRSEWFKENDSWLMSHECAFLDTPEEMDAAIDATRKEKK